MTTDITELAQSLKAAAENAIGAHERLAAYPYGEIIDISQHEGEQIDIDITDLNEFNKEANPVNILALEKAQGMEAYWKTQCRGITDHCEELQARIAELESHTVTVKLPESFKLAKSSSGLRYYYADEVDAAIIAAGIKVEVE
ncbi:hypothetical protein [Klebsiella pneumoniae]|uniref:hypothetical protein n=1 Tax=Klebsiella pneumoniae TaxID=573 RepID=UPI0037ADD5DB